MCPKSRKHGKKTEAQKSLKTTTEATHPCPGPWRGLDGQAPCCPSCCVFLASILLSRNDTKRLMQRTVYPFSPKNINKMAFLSTACSCTCASSCAKSVLECKCVTLSFPSFPSSPLPPPSRHGRYQSQTHIPPALARGSTTVLILEELKVSSTSQGAQTVGLFSFLMTGPPGRQEFNSLYHHPTGSLLSILPLST